VTTNWYDRASLPKFENPPVVEVALAIEFSHIPGLDNYKLGRLQQEWEQDYPTIRDVPGAPPTPAFDQVNAMQINFGQPIQKIWASAPESGLLVQTQADRIILNWRKNEDKTGGRYPGYFDALRPELQRLWGKMTAFIAAGGLPAPVPHMVEFTYVNAVPLGPNEQLQDVVTVVRSPKHALPGQDRFTRFSIVRDVPGSATDEFTSQIHINGEPRPTLEGGTALFFTVVARSILGARAFAPFDGLNAAHALASQSFARIVTNEKQRVWKRIQK
jgi:uncharacterized protein (TIGR04255 family)